MADLFKSVLNMSLTASIATLVVIALRFFLKKLHVPRRVIFLLWAVIFFRMVCPISFESPISLLNPMPPASVGGGVLDTPTLPFDTPSHFPPAAGADHESHAPFTVHSPTRTPAIDWLNLLSFLWALGILALCLWIIVSYLLLKHRVRTAVKATDGVWETDRVDSPFVLGFFPAKIYVPLGLNGETRRCVLLHERAHIRRGDHMIKAIFLLALAVHWFNPLLWGAWVLVCRDVEWACDESVLRSSGEDIRRSYSSALLSLASVHPTHTPLSFGENDVKGRIRGVLRYKKPVAVVSVCAALAVLAVAFTLAANPVEKRPAVSEPTPPPVSATTPPPTVSLAAEGDVSPDCDDRFRIRFPGDTTWTSLDALIPVPESWAADQLAGRDEAKDMVGMLESALGQVGFMTPTDGWLAFCLPTNLGPVDDTYFYRTSDGGHTWKEYSHFTARDVSESLNWFGVSCVDFADENHGYLSTGRFNGAPVFRTDDGGITWEMLPLPLPDGNWECSDIWATEPRLIFTDPEGNPCTVYSVNGGKTWRSVLPINDPEEIPLDQLPWPSYLGAEEDFFPDTNNWYYEPIKLLGLSADRTAALFAFDEGMTGLSGLLLCRGGHLNYFPSLGWSASSRMTSANPIWGDFDGDGVKELAVIVCVGTGTGVSMWDLHIFETDGKSLTLGGSLRAYDDLQDLDLGPLEGSGLPGNARVGCNISFQVEDRNLYASIGIEDSNGIHTVSYIGTLECAVHYDGHSLTPADFKYSEDIS